ncbi:MAG: hypothetical protein IM598_10565 [Chitinophagaceae bacterium]|nr:hypothetical protein [Chitinophagaceae bacterium]MCA6460372.1 hypothetical protein [Chitinophagaceae bacterium]MCA6465259.1 hypothetical protein [Chitinophagaceae bacterium]
MEEVIELQGFRITPRFTEREVNFEVSNSEGYLFRLVPDLEGFRLSPLDKALDAEINPKLAEQIGSWIDNYFS